MAHNSNNETYLVELLYILPVWVYYYFQRIRCVYKYGINLVIKMEYLIKRWCTKFKYRHVHFCCLTCNEWNVEWCVLYIWAMKFGMVSYLMCSPLSFTVKSLQFFELGSIYLSKYRISSNSTWKQISMKHQKANKQCNFWWKDFLYFIVTYPDIP